MKKIILSLTGATVAASSLLLATLALSTPSASAAPSQRGAQTTKKTVYVCPMHPAVVAGKPGKCPKCKMALVKKSVAIAYTCPMHPEVRSLKSGPCPKCKMPMMKMK